jgi:DNA-directed RNA polymerase specialized sigma24 family protein
MILLDIKRELRYRYHPAYYSNLEMMIIEHLDFSRELEKLTELEEKFLFLVVAGYSMREMSALLNISERSIGRRMRDLRLTMLETDPR